MGILNTPRFHHSPTKAMNILETISLANGMYDRQYLHKQSYLLHAISMFQCRKINRCKTLERGKYCLEYVLQLEEDKAHHSKAQSCTTRKISVKMMLLSCRTQAALVFVLGRAEGCQFIIMVHA